MTYRLVLFLCACFLLGKGFEAQAQERRSSLSVQQIMQEPKAWVGAWPSGLRWGEQGQWLYFDWNPQGQFPSDSLYRVAAAGGAPQKVAPEERRDGIAYFTGWHHEEHVYDQAQRRKVYSDDGDLYLFDRRTGENRRLTHTRAPETSPRFSVDGRHVLYQAEDNLFRKNLSTGAVEQVTDLRSGTEEPEEEDEDGFVDRQQERLFETLREEQEEEEAREAARERDRAAQDPPPTFHYGSGRVRQLQLRPGGRFVTFTVQEEPQEVEPTTVLDYVTESGYAQTETARPKVGAPGGLSTLYVQDLKRDTTYAVDLSQLEGAYDVPPFREEELADADSSEMKRDLYAFGPYWNGQGTAALLEVRARDNKDRWIARLDPATGDLETLDRQHDDAWIAGPGISWWGGAGEMGWLPGGERFYFQSEASGYSHLYVLRPETGEKVQLTHGDFEVSDPVLSKDGETWYFLSTEHSPHERHVYRMPAGGGERVRLTQLEGTNELALAPDADVLGLLHSKKNHPPEVYLQPAGGRAERSEGSTPGVRVTHSPTEAWQAYDWRDPEIVRFEASDGAQVPAQLFAPDDPNGAAVLFVHGAGYTQNVVRGWTHYFREYMFHNLLADLGYTVLDVDYRASAGYGRDWRTAVYRHMGGRDLQDYVDAQQYLEATRDIGPERTFIYGGSYGGFLTLMALFTEPEHFGGGAALRSVTDWAHYNHPYTANILNTPAADSLAYARSSPIYFADGLEDPLLMAHGIMDTNVQFQDIVRLSQRLIELGKEGWELAVYPVEGHGFEEPASWTDEYRRILELIEESVGPERSEAVLGATPQEDAVPAGRR